MPRSLEGAAVAITGASSGLGAALAEAFASAGSDVAILARSEEPLRAVAERCRAAGRRASAVPGDVTDPGACEALVGEAIRRYGRLDILVACAGVSMWARFDELRDLSPLREVMEVNYFGLVHATAAALPHVKRAEGLLVAISSIQGVIGVPWHTGYAASKHAVQGFCDSLRIELRGSGVSVLTVLPHWIRGTRLRERAFGPGAERLGDDRPSHREGAITAERAAAEILDAVRRGSRTLVIPRRLRLLPCVATLAPALIDRLVARRVRRESKGRRGKGM